MNKIIILTGTLNDSFIINELPIIREYFDDVYILSYKDKKKVCDEIAETYKIKYEFTSVNCSFFQFLQKIMKWLQSTHIKEELKEINLFSLRGIMKFIYLFMYGIYAIQVYEKIEHEIQIFEGNIYLYSFWLSRSAYAASLFNYDRNVKTKKIFSRAHGYDLYIERNKLNYLPFRKYINKNLDFISFISENGKKYYIQQNFIGDDVSKDQYKLFYLGTYNKSNYMKKVCEKDVIVIASCSSIIEVKRLDLIIMLIEYLQKDLKIKWIHYGSGKLEKKIKKIAGKKLKKNSYIFKGEFDNDKLLEDYMIEDIDFFVNMSDSEGIPVSIMEAISVGIPVLARDVGGIKEIVRNENGCLLEGDISENQTIIRNFIGSRINNTELYKDYSKRAIELWSEKFSAEVNYRNFFCDTILEGM